MNSDRKVNQTTQTDQPKKRSIAKIIVLSLVAAIVFYIVAIPASTLIFKLTFASGLLFAFIVFVIFFVLQMIGRNRQY